jgi:hypothetical protein
MENQDVMVVDHSDNVTAGDIFKSKQYGDKLFIAEKVVKDGQDGQKVCDGCWFMKGLRDCMAAPECAMPDLIFKRVKKKEIHVCNTCGSPRVFVDAYASLNTDEVRTYGDHYCDDCAGGCSVTEVQVKIKFDLATDYYKWLKL